jgi:hypothetical protein
LALGVLGRDSWRILFGAGCLIAAGMVGRVGGAPMPYRVPIGFHVTLLTILALGWAFDDALGRWLRSLGATLAVLGCLAVMAGRSGGGSEGLPTWVPSVYPLAMCLVLAAYGRWLEHRASLFAAGLVLAAWLTWSGWRGYRSLRQLVAGLDYIALGMASFALAWLTSLAKGGVLSPGVRREQG